MKKKRSEILDDFNTLLRQRPEVIAVYEGGSVAFGRDDDESDIDLYLITESVENFATLFKTIESYLEDDFGIECKHIHPWPKETQTVQRFYRLKSYSPNFLIDLAIISQEATEKYLAQEIHGVSHILFDKKGITHCPPIDQNEWNKKIFQSWKTIEEKHNLFSSFVFKELKRGNFLEALDLYRLTIINPLVACLRIKHAPFHFDWGFKSIRYDLPVANIEKLNKLMCVSSLQDLEQKTQEALRWLELEKADIILLEKN